MDRLTKRVDFIQTYLDGIFSEDLHAKRVKSLTNGTLGVMTSASLAVSIIGQSLAQARGLLSKHAIKQVDRLLSNQGIVVWDMFAPWVAEVVGQRKSIVVAMDWTDFDADNQTTLALNLVTNHGRATPLLWLTVLKDELKDRRNDYEDLCLARLAEVLPEGVAVTILADRGFGDTKLFAYLETLGFAYVIRFRGNIHVSAADGETRAAAAWVDGRTSAQAARRRGHGGPPQGRGGRLRQGQGHERGLVSGRQQRRGERTRDHQLLRQALDDRAGLSRHQGPSFRHGPKRSSHRRSATARPASSPERLRHRSPDAARRRRRKPRHGSPSQGQHRQTPDPFAVPAGLYALRVDPEHAGGPPAAARRAVQRIHRPKQSLGSDLLGRMKNEGMAEDCTQCYVGNDFFRLRLINLSIFCRSSI